ncbi:MAG: nucleoside 2-deoxyribosyltransferase [Alphaproteobacteria bacterium]
MLLYMAAPLFNPMERERNLALDITLREWGYDTFLPQRDGELSYTSLQTEADITTVRTRIFHKDVHAIKTCDAVIALLDGRVPDEGLCVELGMAYAWNKPCVGYKTDARGLDAYGDSLMIDGCLTVGKTSTLEGLKSLLAQIG